MINFTGPGPEGSTPYSGDISDLKPKHIRTLGELNEYESNNIMRAHEWLIKHQSGLYIPLAMVMDAIVV